jgi:hypothetical protein
MQALQLKVLSSANAMANRLKPADERKSFALFVCKQDQQKSLTLILLVRL